ncbi:hypothetical protein RF11_01900 [Thelohanellus kitauei]|uniref:Reverse transcriptase RNase H-like domain-containing protein n=1 Tax=Thelohanellus kitauei TaxID=669202 RepID=A0A0C2IML1_THEKT|nr:hypothetical protein RF11_01900 [Thelohanellus kitauei]
MYLDNWMEDAALLYMLTNNVVSFNWSEVEDETFKFKEKLRNLHTISFYLLPRLTIRAYLSQTINGVEKPKAYASSHFSHSEEKYSTIYRELLARYLATKTFTFYLIGRHFLLLTDNNPPTYIDSIRYLQQKGRYDDVNKEFDFTISHIMGSSNIAQQESQLVHDDKTKKSLEIITKILSTAGLKKTFEPIRRKFNCPGLYYEMTT